MSSRKWLLAAGLAGVVLGAGLPEWISTVELKHKLEEVFYRNVPFGAYTVAWRKPPKETRPALAQQIQQTPAEAQLYYLRAREDEAQLDFTAAEADWAKYVETSPDKAGAFLEKAAYHGRRLEPEKRLNALLEAAKLPVAGADRYRPAASQASWRSLEEAWRTVGDQLMGEARAAEVLRAWETRYPSETAVFERAFAWSVERTRWSDAEGLIGRYQRAFPADEVRPLSMRATLEKARGNGAAAIAIYERAYRPDWSAGQVESYFALLDESGGRRQFLAEARSKAASDPASLDAASRLFLHYRASQDVSSAQRVLFELSRARQGRWTAGEQLLIGSYYLSVQSYEEAARRFQAAYLSNDTEISEKALAALIELLIAHAGQSFRFGGGDLSFYRDVATMDTSPGYWNGILSLVLNGQTPAAELSQQEGKAVPYFHRAAAAALLRQFDQKFARSPRRAALHASVIEASAQHAEADRVARLGREYLAAFPGAGERTTISLLTADALARLNQTQEEFAVYDALLDELSAKADRMPIGEAGMGANSVARSAEYARVLDRYIGRLTALKQTARALALYRREIDRNPNDPGLYERLAAFLEQNKLGAEIEATYRKAMTQFPDKSWSHKLARYYLRQKMTAQFDALSREVAGAFSGTELEKYLAASAEGGSLDPVLYRQVNLYAYRRFPHHLPFARNLLAAYSNRATANAFEWERLMRAHWVYDSSLRSQFFAYLSQTKKLDVELAAMTPQAAANPVAALWVAEAEAWKGHFEKSAPLLRALTADFPADTELGARAAAMHRSLNDIDAATQIEETLAKAHPGDAAIWTRLGEMQADQERFDKASAYWAKIPLIAPGRPGQYLENATLHWDYYRFDDALAQIGEARKKLNQPRLYAFEAGAIYENKGDYSRAAGEYVAGAIGAGVESNEMKRLLRVAQRAAWKAPLESALNAAGNGAGALAVRVALLESQARRPELESLLLSAIGNADASMLDSIRNHAQRSGLRNAERAVLERQLALADYPAARMQALAAKMRFEESVGGQAAAGQAVETLLRENPRSVGAVRTAVNYYWRTGARMRAADVLLASAPNAYPALRRQLHLEAVKKLIEAGEYARAHRETAALLSADPLDEQVLSLKADAYSRSKDDRALSALYRDAMAAMQGATLPAQAKAQRIALLRRAWIPPLARLNDHAGAADQYIELLKQYPEDESLQREAATYAAENGQRDKLTGYFAKAETDSPRDARWPVVRARLEEGFGDPPAALAAWGRAVALRPERVDFLASRAKLEVRLSQFDKAVASYRKLYEISFRNSAWLEEGAHVLARQGKAEECVKWLREALIDNRPAAIGNTVQMANRLLEWGMVEQAATEAMQGLNQLTREDSPHQIAAIYAQAAARLRQFDQIPAAVNAKMPLYAPQVGVGVRQSWLEASADVARVYYSPEEKTKFAAWFEAQRSGLHAEVAAQIARRAGLPGVAARILQQAMLADAGGDAAARQMNELEQLQRQRLQFSELARHIEAYHRVFPNKDEKAGLLEQARQAFLRAGEEASELRILALQYNAGALAGEGLDRYFELLTRRSPVLLSPRQQRDDAFLDGLVSYGLRVNKPAVVSQAATGRRTALWQSGTRALTGLYLGENSPAVRKAFLDTLGPERIGDKLALAGDRDSVLTGGLWFYYAGRYGAWLQYAKDANSPHYLAAMVERRSNSAEAYLSLAEESPPEAAEQSYRTALILDEHQPVAHARLARAAVARGDRAAAAAGYRKALEELRWWQDNRRVPEWYWTEALQVMREADRANLRGEVQDQAEALVRGYVRRNGSYRVRELLEGLMVLAGDEAAGIDWISRISLSAADPAGFLAQINGEGWLPEAGRELLLWQQLTVAMDRYNKGMGEEREFLRNQADKARLRLASLLLQRGRADAARPLIEMMASNPDMRPRYDVAGLRLKLAASAGGLDKALQEIEVSPEYLRTLAAELRQEGKADAARTVLRDSYMKDWKAGNLQSALTGLAALHLEMKEDAKAIALLDKLAWESDAPFGQHWNAAGVLYRAGRKAEAVRYLEPLAGAEPWNRSARQMLAEAKADEPGMAALAADTGAAYKDRVNAARWMGSNKPRAMQAGAGELDYLASGSYPERGADQPYWVAGRLAAASASKDAAVQARLYRGAIANETDETLMLPLMRILAGAGRWREVATVMEGRSYLAVTPEDRTRVGEAYLRTGETQRAINTFGEDAGLSARARQLKASATAQLEREAQNEERRPRIAEELDQTLKVKPRLTAGGAR